jgi:hypothetical protein
MKRFVLYTIIVISLARCSEDDNGNGCVPVSKALEEVSSLSNIVKAGRVAGRPSCVVYAGARIYACEYKGETTYVFTNPASSNSLCGWIVYDCHGEELINRGSDEAAWTAFDAERSELEELWKKP